MPKWQEHLSRKPDPNALPPGAAEALKEAEATIGNRLLKTQPDYVAPPGHNTQLKVCLLRKEIHDTKRAFNEKVLELREHKLKMVEQMKQIGDRLAEIRAEVPPKLAKCPPKIPEIDDDLEFPEKNLEVKPEPIQVGQRLAKKSIVPERKTHTHPTARVRAAKVPPFTPIMESRPLAATWELLKSKQDQDTSPLELEIRERRIERHLYEQDMLLADAEVSVQQFDSRLRQLQRERIRVQERNQLLELHLYKLHQEMNVLNRFEAHEDRLAERVYAKLMQVRAVQDQIVECEHRIEEHKAEKQRLDGVCQDIQRQFKKLVQDNKFADFLRRIFKKKYRPPRDHEDDESSESESSESSTEEDEGSIDSRDIGPIRLDPNICPEGCEQEIYDNTYQLRNNRHQHEQEMIEQDHLVDLLRKDIDAHNKVKRKLSVQLDTRKNELREFMMEKQNCMNDVDEVILLHYDQIRASAIKDCTGSQGLSQTVVFPEALLARLRKRVLELQDEIAQQKQRQKVNRTHLHRMNIDLRVMEAQAEELRAKMRDVLTRKLGKPRRVDRTLDDLLRQMARRHKYMAAAGAIPMMLNQLRQWRDRHSDLEKKYLSSIQSYSTRLRLAAALQADVLPQKPYKNPTNMVGGYTPEQYQRDVVRLRIVRSQQMQQIKALQEEINALRIKPLAALVTPPPSLSRPASSESHLQLMMIPHGQRRMQRTKYFPITPLGSQVQVYDVNVMKLLYDCLDAMKVTRDDAIHLLRDLKENIPHILTGKQSRYDVVDMIVRKWLLKYGGDPSLYKKQTRAFDALALLTDKLIRDNVCTAEGSTSIDHGVMESLEQALKEVSDVKKPLNERLGPALAALFLTAESQDLESEETLASLINSLIDEESSLTMETINNIDVFEVIEDVKDCGVQAPPDEIENIVLLAIECLRAQLSSPEEARRVEEEVQQAMKMDKNAPAKSGRVSYKDTESLIDDDDKSDSK